MEDMYLNKMKTRDSLTVYAWA